MPRRATTAKDESANEQAVHQLHRSRDDEGRRHAGGARALPELRHAAAGEPGDPRARARRVLVVRQLLARRVPHRRRRPRHQGAVPALCLALGAVRVLRQPALDQGGQGRRGDRGPRQGPDQLRELDALQRQAEGRAVLRRGDHLGPAGRREVLGAAAQALQRAGAGRDRLLHRADDGAAALAAHAQHRAPPDPGRARTARWRRASRPKRR